MKIGIIIALLLAAPTAQAQQTPFYGPDGRSIGTAVPLGDGSVRYYDERSKSLGTSTTTGNTTRFYDERGRPTGSFQFDGRMRRQGKGGEGASPQASAARPRLNRRRISSAAARA